MNKVEFKDNTTKEYRVSALSWERVFLHFTIESDSREEVSFKLRRFTRWRKRPKRGEPQSIIPEMFYYESHPITPVCVDEKGYHFVLNITALDDATFLENGKWQIQVMKGEEEFTCSVCYELAYQLDDKSRIFKYDGAKYSYDVSFSTYSEDGKLLSFVMDSHFMEENNSWRKRHYIKEALTKAGKVDRVYYTAVILLIRLYYQILEHLSPKKGKKILFMTETKPYLWGNLKYINDKMIERGLDKEFQISYSLRNAVGSHKSMFSWIRLVTLIAKQDYIFVDDYVPIFGFLELNDRTKLIQVWHAGEGFKAVGYCRFGKDGSPFPAGSCHKQYDYAVTGANRLVHVYSEVFGLPENKFLPVGMARLDGFLDEDKIKAVKEDFYSQYPALKGKKLILFAPTYRGTGQKTAFYDYDKLDMKRIYEMCGDEYVWAFKMHPFVTEKPKIDKAYAEKIIDLSKWENINDLYYVTELLITDYSSAYYEFALVEKPVLFFTYDRESYELTRGVHKSVKDSAPGKVCDTFNEMLEAIEKKDFDYEKTQRFREENFANYDGDAANKIIDTILLSNQQ